MIRVQTFYIDGQPYVNGEWRKWEYELNPKCAIPPKLKEGEHWYNPETSFADNNEKFYGTYQVYSIITCRRYDKEADNGFGGKGKWIDYSERVDGWINPQGTDCMNIGKGDNGIGYLYKKIYPKIFEMMNIELPKDEKEYHMILYYLVGHINLIRGISMPMWYATYRFNFEIVSYMITHYEEFIELIKKFKEEYERFTRVSYFQERDYAKSIGWDGIENLREWWYKRMEVKNNDTNNV